jgi:hypothetical protein
MELDKDFREFIELLNGHNVQYLVIAGLDYSKPKFHHKMFIFTVQSLFIK